MSVTDRIKEKMQERSTVEIDFFGEKLKVELISMAKLKNVPTLTEEEQIKFLQSKILDPETNKPAFTVKYMEEEMPNAYLSDLLFKFFDANREAETTIEELEKN